MRELRNIWEWNFEPEEKKEEKPVAGKVQDLTPGMKDTVQAIEDKISKLGLKTKINLLYAARKDVYNPARSTDGFVGSMNQFHIIGRNAIVPYRATLAFYAFKNYMLGLKKSKFVSSFKKRKMKSGGNPFILNIEELATIWHFPLPFVKTPLVPKASVKRAEPPMGLPVESLEGPLRKILTRLPEEKKEETPPPPPLQYG